jgi:hypothetical protein
VIAVVIASGARAPLPTALAAAMALLSSWAWAGAARAQAEQAPPEPGAPSPRPPPSSGGTGIAPPPPVPDPGAPGSAAAAPSRSRFDLAIVPRFAVRLGQPADAVSPALGFALAGTFEVRYAAVAPLLELGLALEFSHHRFATGETGVVIRNGVEEAFGSTRTVLETSFLVAQVLAARLGRVRPHLLVGAGIGLGHFDSAAREFAPGTANDTQLIARAAVGVDVALVGAMSLTVRSSYTAVRATRRLETETGASLPLFGDLFDVGVGVVYSF